jgi:hypothetical protein
MPWSQIMHQPHVPGARPRPRHADARHVAVLAVTVLAAACGGSESSGAQAVASGPPVRIDACALLSAADVGTALGTTVSEPTKREAGSGDSLATICLYDGGWPNSVNLTVRQSARAGEAGTSMDLVADLNKDLDDLAADSTTADLVEGGRWEALDIQGHAAAVRDAGEGGWTVAVRKDGRRAVEVMINAPSKEAGVALARTVMDRLK